MTSSHNHLPVLSKLKLFFALSRTQHGLIDMATPALCALLWLGEFPPLRTIFLGLITTFAGYTAVYALNDVVDFRADKEKLQQAQATTSDNYLDDLFTRHPMASGTLGLQEGVIWVIAWSLLAIVGAYLLNPICVIIFMGGCALEVIYCALFKITHLKTLVSGVVKTTGAMAAIFAVDPHPSFPNLFIFFLWLFFWEIGGQNVPADWTDIEEDRQFKAKTIPVRYGPGSASVIIIWAIILTLLMNAILLRSAGANLTLPYVCAAFLTGLYLLVFPAVLLYRTKNRLQAIRLFNKASFYPLVLLVIVTVNILL